MGTDERSDLQYMKCAILRQRCVNRRARIFRTLVSLELTRSLVVEEHNAPRWDPPASPVQLGLQCQRRSEGYPPPHRTLSGVRRPT